MRITKRGTPPGERIWNGTCNACRSEAEAKESELKHVTHCQREGSFSWEICPVCGAGDKSSGYGGMIFYPASK